MLDKIAAVIYVITFGFAYYRMFVLPKGNRKLNGVTWILLTILLEASGQALVAGIINAFHAPVNLWTVSAINLVMGLTAWGICFKTKQKKQSYEWKKYDICYAVILFVAGIIFLFWFKGFRLDPVFCNSDAAVHFKNAMSVVRDEALPTMYFSELWNAMAIRCVIPFIGEINAVRVYVLMDWLYFVLEIWMFVAILREYVDDVKATVAAVVFTIMYLLGYPMLGYLYTFLYWGMGVMLIGAVYLLLKKYREEKISYGFTIVSMMLLCNAITMCYMLFGPYVFVMLALYLTYLWLVTKRKLDLAWLKMCFGIFLLPTALAVYYCYFQFLAAQSLSVGSVMSIVGGAYQEAYVHFIWLLIPFVVEVICSIRRKRMDETMLFSIGALLMVGVLTVLYLRGRIGYYYYSKYFNVLWFALYVDAFKGMLHILKWKWQVVCGYAVVVAAGFFVFWSVHIFPETTAQMDVYKYNTTLFQASHNQCAKKFMDTCQYVMKKLPKKDTVPIMLELESYSTCYWYEGITGKNSAEYYTWSNNKDDVFFNLAQQKVPYFVIVYGSGLYKDYKDFFDQFECLDRNSVSGVYASYAATDASK